MAQTFKTWQDALNAALEGRDDLRAALAEELLTQYMLFPLGPVKYPGALLENAAAKQLGLKICGDKDCGWSTRWEQAPVPTPAPQFVLVVDPVSRGASDAYGPASALQAIERQQIFDRVDVKSRIVHLKPL